MKLLFCPRCLDMFKLVVHEPRSCRCGYVRGHLKNNEIGMINGNGISVAIDNGSLVQSVNKLQALQQNRDLKYYAEQTPLSCWVRPHTGEGNPRTSIREDLDSSADIAFMLGQAVKHFRQEHGSDSVVPKWVEDAERILQRRGRLGE